ncbi:MAG: UDP-N-acetylenolpyruvoylglucosamine reductase [Verrucomicrobia bacterium A1]|nr:MAG: UDP-N-acetylenolpyruvoylglucosamine reductase [Verrucomicrobia bacterium A1]
MRVAPGARLADVTTFRLGGPCRALVECPDARSLAGAVTALRAAGLPFLLIGGGSNLLVSDEGFAGVVVRLASDAPAFRCDGEEIVAAASAPLDALAAFSVRQALEGLLFASGIPGTVGGAVAGNAGAFGEDVSGRLVSVTVLDPDGQIREEDPSRFRFAYRHSEIPAQGAIVTEVRLRLASAGTGPLAAERDRILALRAAKHPDWRSIPTAGSFFRNVEPTSAAGRRQAAGWFLEQAGVKSMTDGGARVYEKHANIVVKGAPDCTAADVDRLTRRMAAAVKSLFDLTLVPEVRRIGHFPD